MVDFCLRNNCKSAQICRYTSVRRRHRRDSDRMQLTIYALTILKPEHRLRPFSLIHSHHSRDSPRSLGLDNRFCSATITKSWVEHPQQKMLCVSHFWGSHLASISRLMPTLKRPRASQKSAKLHTCRFDFFNLYAIRI